VAVCGVESWLKVASLYFEGANIDDCVTSKDMKGHSDELVKLCFLPCHMNISVWVLTQQLSSIAYIALHYKQRSCCFTQLSANIGLFIPTSFRTTHFRTT